MELVYVICVGVLTFSGIFLCLRGRTFPVVVGLTMLGYAVNMFLFSSGRLHLNSAAVLGEAEQYADPLPQALVLTAIVIGFAMIAFVVILSMRARADLGSDFVDGREPPDTSKMIDKKARPGVIEHLPILPIIVPMVGGLFMLLPPFAGVERYNNRRVFAFILAVSQLLIALWMLQTVTQGPAMMYAVGNWQPPFGIILFADPLSAMLVTLNSFLGLGIILYAFAGEDRAGRYFHPLIQFQILGINGAFLTNDLFNLFVFEVLLIASYSLLIHAGRKQRIESAVHYVILNLIGSSIFLFALGTMYGALGTLNIADMALKISSLNESNRLLAHIGGAMLLVVFGLKSAMLPLHFLVA